MSEDLRNKSTLEESPCISGKSACVHLHNKLLHAVSCIALWTEALPELRGSLRFGTSNSLQVGLKIENTVTPCDSSSTLV